MLAPADTVPTPIRSAIAAMLASDGIAVASCFTDDGCGVLMPDRLLRLVVGWGRPVIVMDGPLALAGHAAAMTAAIEPVRIEIRKLSGRGCRYATLLACTGRTRRFPLDIIASCAISWDLTEDCQAIRNVVIRLRTERAGMVLFPTRTMH